MWCMKCNHDLMDCTCPDLKERLASANASPYVFIQTCKTCGEHHSRCKCSPETRDLSKPGEKS
jgi:hypothetical protein